MSGRWYRKGSTIIVLLDGAEDHPGALGELEEEKLTAAEKAAKEQRRRAARRRWADRQRPHTGTAQSGCDPQVHARLQREVETRCVDYGCASDNGCGSVKQHGRRAVACANARALINQRCYQGGDAGHRTAQRQAADAAANCRTRHVELGCGKPDFELEWELMFGG